MTVARGLESLAARYQRATVHGLTVQSTVVAVVQACSGRRTEVLPMAGAQLRDTAQAASAPATVAGQRAAIAQS